MSPRSGSEKREVQPSPEPAQWSVGSMDDDGILYGFTTHCLIASTIATAPTIVTTQSIATLHGRGRRYVRRSTGFLMVGLQCVRASARGASPSFGRGLRTTRRPGPSRPGTPQAEGSAGTRVLPRGPR